MTTVKTKKPSITSLSDLDSKTALATLAAMEYSDIIHLSYREAIRLWVPLYTKIHRVATLREYGLPDYLSVNRLWFMIESLQDTWLKHHKPAPDKGNPRVEGYPSIFYDSDWRRYRDMGAGEENPLDSTWIATELDIQWIGL